MAGFDFIQYCFCKELSAPLGEKEIRQKYGMNKSMNSHNTYYNPGIDVTLKYIQRLLLTTLPCTYVLVSLLK